MPDVIGRTVLDAKYCAYVFELGTYTPQGRIQEGGSKIKFMKGEGTGGGVLPPLAGHEN